MNLGGWLVLEPWIKPSLFTQFALEDEVKDQWTFCEKLGKAECKKQLEEHWDTWLTKDDLQGAGRGRHQPRAHPSRLLDTGRRQGRRAVGDGRPGLPGARSALDERGGPARHTRPALCCRAVRTASTTAAAWARCTSPTARLPVTAASPTPTSSERCAHIDALTKHFSADEYAGTVVGIEPVNEAFVSIPLEIVKDYYVQQSYEAVKKYGDLAVVIGDSFRFGSWGDFMFPPHYRHVWIDTHIYQVFDAYRLSLQHRSSTCSRRARSTSPRWP